MSADEMPLSGTWLPGELRRYVTADYVASSTLGDIPRLIRAAWDHALNFPDIGDEIMADLQADVQQIITDAATAARERAAQLADKQRRDTALEIGIETESRLADAVALTVVSLDSGFDPRGCFVYLLWENEHDPVPIYVGKSTNLMSRLGSHMQDREKRYRVRWVTLIRCRDGRQMDKTEARLIRKFRPELNTAGIPIP